MRYHYPLLLWLCALCAIAQYRPIELPDKWTFQSPTPAYSTEDPNQVLGTFQPGIEVDVLEIDAPTQRWHVVFRRYGSADVHSLMDPPNLAKANQGSFRAVQEDIEAFPLLQALLEAEAPWPEKASGLARTLGFASEQIQIVSGSSKAATKLSLNTQSPNAQLWGITPLSLTVDYGLPTSPRITIEVWHKGDAYQSTINPSQTHRELQANLQRIQSAFPTHLEDPGTSNAAAAITAVRLNEEVYLLPNDLRLSLRYAHDEYVILSIESIQHLQSTQPTEYDPSQFRDQIRQQLAKSPSGHLYIQNIPMIDQGQKGYCAAATLARVLQFYDYPVDVHATAEQAKTEGQMSEFDTGGTRRDDILKAIRRISNSTPFRLSQLKKERPEAIMEVIEQGIPILWFIPGHARLLIGIHPESNEIVFSDSWGPEYQYRTAPWDYFVNANEEMWYLEPR